MDVPCKARQECSSEKGDSKVELLWEGTMSRKMLIQIHKNSSPMHFEVKSNSNQMSFATLSTQDLLYSSVEARISEREAGTRIWRRDANLEGNTANFIATEQLLEFGGFRSSLLQICSQHHASFNFPFVHKINIETPV
ncbi:hypothetical protein RJ639_027551 [Escallonia herrerae]|uniref:SAC domain-containing protein n=1 Tax=Escallonia herrerae TaxID=1293975 RepID=A0AA89BFC8_9ASTE|nr:hypothetical protein RJ639_027551 [Escallonia herrerae]